MAKRDSLETVGLGVLLEIQNQQAGGGLYIMGKEKAARWLNEEIERLKLAPAINGCGMTPEWAEQLEIMETLRQALTPQNEPLTLEQLREMDGEPAWWDDGYGSCWGIISVDSAGMWGGIPFFRGRWREVNFEYNIEERKMKIYRRPLEGKEARP